MDRKYIKNYKNFINESNTTKMKKYTVVIASTDGDYTSTDTATGKDEDDAYFNWKVDMGYINPDGSADDDWHECGEHEDKNDCRRNNCTQNEIDNEIDDGHTRVTLHEM